LELGRQIVRFGVELARHQLQLLGDRGKPFGETAQLACRHSQKANGTGKTVHQPFGAAQAAT
jgi:hypothetical protein